MYIHTLVANRILHTLQRLVALLCQITTETIYCLVKCEVLCECVGVREQIGFDTATDVSKRRNIRNIGLYMGFIYEGKNHLEFKKKLE